MLTARPGMVKVTVPGVEVAVIVVLPPAGMVTVPVAMTVPAALVMMYACSTSVPPGLFRVKVTLPVAVQTPVPVI